MGSPRVGCSQAGVGTSPCQVSAPPGEGLAPEHGARNTVWGTGRLTVWHTVHIWILRRAETVLTCLGNFLRPESDPGKGPNGAGKPGAPEKGRRDSTDCHALGLDASSQELNLLQVLLPLLLAPPSAWVAADVTGTFKSGPAPGLVHLEV